MNVMGGLVEGVRGGGGCGNLVTSPFPEKPNNDYSNKDTPDYDECGTSYFPSVFLSTKPRSIISQLPSHFFIVLVTILVFF